MTDDRQGAAGADSTADSGPRAARPWPPPGPDVSWWQGAGTASPRVVEPPTVEPDPGSPPPEPEVAPARSRPSPRAPRKVAAAGTTPRPVGAKPRSPKPIAQSTTTPIPVPTGPVPAKAPLPASEAVPPRPIGTVTTSTITTTSLVESSTEPGTPLVSHVHVESTSTATPPPAGSVEDDLPPVQPIVETPAQRTDSDPPDDRAAPARPGGKRLGTATNSAWVSAPARPTAHTPLPANRPIGPAEPEAAFPLPRVSENLPSELQPPLTREYIRRPKPAAPRRPRRRALRRTRRPLLGIPALMLFALLAAFFGWFAANQFALAQGRGEPGTATVATCTSGWAGKQCTATYTATDQSQTVNRVRVLGVDDRDLKPGATVPVRLASSSARLVYGGDSGGANLRWAIGLVLVLLCALGIAWATGAARLATRRAKTGAWLLSFAGPLLLTAGLFAMALV